MRALVLALLLSGCSVMPLVGGGNSGGDGRDDEANRNTILVVLLFGAWGLWMDSKDECKVPEKCE